MSNYQRYYNVRKIPSQKKNYRNINSHEINLTTVYVLKHHLLGTIITKV